MAAHLLIYNEVEPINAIRHKQLHVKASNDFAFAKNVNISPLTAIEFPKAAVEYPIVFTGNDDNIMPIAVLGTNEKENLFFSDDNKWEAEYIPAFVRRYPFVFSSQDDGKTLTLCIDKAFEGCNDDGRGEALFDAEGERTQYLNNVLSFSQEYQAHFQRTQLFCKKLKELNLLEPMVAQFTDKEGNKRSLTGFMAINRDRLKALSGDKLEELAKTDGLELAYLHLQSMANFNKLVSKAARIVE